jgi:hypothetical protein
MARRLLLRPGVGRLNQEANPNEVRCVMEALIALYVFIAFVGGGPDGKAGW